MMAKYNTITRKVDDIPEFSPEVSILFGYKKKFFHHLDLEKQALQGKSAAAGHKQNKVFHEFLLPFSHFQALNGRIHVFPLKLLAKTANCQLLILFYFYLFYA